MPIYEILCRSCGHVFEEILKRDEETPPCPQCESKVTETLPSAFGGYNMNSGGSSTRPKGAGSFKRSK